MTISILFSVAIFQIATNEVSTRLTRLQTGIEIQPAFNNQQRPIDTIRLVEAAEASSHLIIGLVYANVLVLVLGGAGSYVLARRTLRPIEKAHEAQSRFTSDASHELRTPLAAMKAELEVTLRDTSANKKDLIEVLQSNLEEVEKLSRLSDMLLNLSRLDHDKLERTAVDLVDVTKDVLKRYNLPAKRITISASKQSLVEGNEPALIELVAVLVDNALKYSPNDSLVSIKIGRQNKHATFEITNAGPGIAEDKLPHIFDRFYRADTSRTKQAQDGYGLGLSLAKKIVEIHHGELTVSSTPGTSTIFNIVLPLYSTRPSKK